MYALPFKPFIVSFHSYFLYSILIKSQKKKIIQSLLYKMLTTIASLVPDAFRIQMTVKVVELIISLETKHANCKGLFRSAFHRLVELIV